jgi:hypothetical protein
MVLAGNNSDPVRLLTTTRSSVLVTTSPPEEDDGMGTYGDEALILFAVIILLAGILRRYFGSDLDRTERKLAKARDYGLLSEVATVPSEQAATFVRDLLRSNGIRATTAPDDNGATQHVLVFPADAHAAANVLLQVNDGGE